MLALQATPRPVSPGPLPEAQWLFGVEARAVLVPHYLTLMLGEMRGQLWQIERAQPEADH